MDDIKSLDIIEDTRAYYSVAYGERILEEIFYNAYRTIRNVYLFEKFDDYVSQLISDKNEDKKKEYWKASYYEKLNDFVKISIAFENFNKAILIKQGYLVHKIKKTDRTKELHKIQNKGEPVLIEEFKKISSFKRDRIVEKYYLEGLQNGFPTITYSQTLNESHQKIIKLDSELLYRLKEINNKRNRLHFFTDFKGAFEVNSHVEKWRFIKEESIKTIERQIKN